MKRNLLRKNSDYFFYLGHIILQNGSQNFHPLVEYNCYCILDSKIHTLCEILDIMAFCPLNYKSNLNEHLEI